MRPKITQVVPPMARANQGGCLLSGSSKSKFSRSNFTTIRSPVLTRKMGKEIKAPETAKCRQTQMFLRLKDVKGRPVGRGKRMKNPLRAADCDV